MRVSEIRTQINFKNQQHSEIKKENTALAICGGMLLLPLIPIIDGDSFKSTIKNRNVAKFVTGMAAIGGMIAGLQLLCKKYCDEKNKPLLNTSIFAVSAPLMLLVDKWAEKDKKLIAKKWYFVSAIAGGAVGYIMSKITKKNNIQ